MTRKRKIRQNSHQENQEEHLPVPVVKEQHPLFIILKKVQGNEAFHKKYMKESVQLYAKIGHENFMKFFGIAINKLVHKDADHHFANIALDFCAKFVTSFDGEDTHPLLASTISLILNFTSTLPMVRFRMCQFINMILGSLGHEAALDDSICENILKYMFDRLKDASLLVREQAIYALQRLQVPEDPNDRIVKLYQFHLSSDPSYQVRKAVVSSIGRNFNTIPFIMERLWDSDERVRRHTYFQMSSYPVKTYKVAQRLTFLEQGLQDHSESVKKVVCSIMIPQWLEAYNKNILAFISSLKLDANEEEFNRFQRTAKLALLEIFKSQDIDALISALPIPNAEDLIDNEFPNCILLDKLTIESSLYWASLIDFIKQDAEKATYLEDILPDLKLFCQYINRFCEDSRLIEMDKWQKLQYQYILRSLTEILHDFDLTDEVGKHSLKDLLAVILTKEDLDECLIKQIVKCVENIILDSDERLQFFHDIIRSIIDPSSSGNVIDFSNKSIVEILEKDPNLKVKVSSLKLAIMELKEKETQELSSKNYQVASQIAEELNTHNEQLNNLMISVLNSSQTSSSIASITSSIQSKKLTSEVITKCLQIVFYAVNSEKNRSLNLNMVQLYKDFIRRQMESSQMTLRDWALKCGTTFSMLYEHLAKDVYEELLSQFFKHQNILIWSVSIRAIFELIDRYSYAFFTQESDVDQQPSQSSQTNNKSKKPSSRQLFNATEYLDQDEPDTQQQIDLMHMFNTFLDSCKETVITSALVDGFCRLLLHDKYSSNELVSKLMLMYFSATTEPEINQILGIFFESLVYYKKQECLQLALLKTLFAIFEAPNESPLREIKPEVVLKFVINSTKPIYCPPGLHIHDNIATSCTAFLLDNGNNKDLVKLLTKEMLTLEISDNAKMREDLKESMLQLNEMPLEQKSKLHIKSFIQILDGTFEGALTFSSTAVGMSDKSKSPNNVASDEDNADELSEGEENENDDDENVENQNPNEQNKNAPSETNGQVMTQQTRQPERTPIVMPATQPSQPAKEKRSPTVIPTTPAKAKTPQASELSFVTSPIDASFITAQNEKESAEATTTYGVDNSTHARSLRKSLHPRKSDEGLPPAKSKKTVAAKNKKGSKKPVAESTRVMEESVEPDKMSETNDSSSDEIPATPPPTSKKMSAKKTILSKTVGRTTRGRTHKPEDKPKETPGPPSPQRNKRKAHSISPERTLVGDKTPTVPASESRATRSRSSNKPTKPVTPAKQRKTRDPNNTSLNTIIRNIFKPRNKRKSRASIGNSEKKKISSEGHMSSPNKTTSDLEDLSPSQIHQSKRNKIAEKSDESSEECQNEESMVTPTTKTKNTSSVQNDADSNSKTIQATRSSSRTRQVLKTNERGNSTTKIATTTSRRNQPQTSTSEESISSPKNTNSNETSTTRMQRINRNQSKESAVKSTTQPQVGVRRIITESSKHYNVVLSKTPLRTTDLRKAAEASVNNKKTAQVSRNTDQKNSQSKTSVATKDKPPPTDVVSKNISGNNSPKSLKTSKIQPTQTKKTLPVQLIKSKLPTRQILSATSSTQHRTRRVIAEEFLQNNIITRKRVSSISDSPVEKPSQRNISPNRIKTRIPIPKAIKK